MSDAPTLLRDRYELGRVLGAGRGSTTHLATDTTTGEPCVVKALSVGDVVRGASGAHSFDGDDFTKLVELFEREARVLAHLSHPGIPRFVDHFTEAVDGDTRLYTVQEYVPGKTLDELVRAGRHFSEEEAKDVCRQTADILRYLHDRSPPLIHRDVKPSNVIAGEDGTVHLVDFGSVRNAIGGDQLDGKTIVGTYGYMPIEQYEARALPQSDLYALGMTLVFLLSHREPTEIPRRGMTLDFRPYVSVSDRFAAVIARMIEAAPEARHESAEELLRDLSGRPEQVAPPVRRSRADAQRMPFVALAGAVVAAFGLGVAGLWLTSDPGSGPPPLPPAAGGGGERVTGRPPVEPVAPADGMLTIDIYRNFWYMPSGWPMGRSVGQTALGELTAEPFEDLVVPREWRRREAGVLYGFFPLGNGPDRRYAFALVSERGVWSLHVDLNNNEDLTDDGPPTFNEGTGMILAAEVAPIVEVVDPDGLSITRPYHLWTWFNQPDDRGRVRGRFYARNHYQGAVQVAARVYAATAFEFRDHDALFRDSGVCIDLNGDGECQESAELFRDGDVVPFPEGAYPLALRYP